MYVRKDISMYQYMLILSLEKNIMDYFTNEDDKINYLNMNQFSTKTRKSLIPFNIVERKGIFILFNFFLRKSFQSRWNHNLVLGRNLICSPLIFFCAGQTSPVNKINTLVLSRKINKISVQVQHDMCHVIISQYIF